MSTDNHKDKDIRFASTKGATSQPNGAITVESLYGPAIAKPRIEAKAILWAANADLGALRSRHRHLARLFMYDFARRCNRHGDPAAPSYVCFPGYRAIQSELGITSRDTIKSKVEQLERCGLITITRRKGKGKRGGNIYRLNLDCKVATISTGSPSLPVGGSPSLPLDENQVVDCLDHKGINKLFSKKKKKPVKVAALLATGAESANEGNGEEEKTSIDVQEFPAVALDCTMGEQAKEYFTSLISDHDITQKAQGQLGMYATKLLDLGLDWRAVMKHTLENWEVFRWYAENRGDEFKLPEHPSPARMLSNVNHSAQLYRDYLQDQIDDAEREATRARLREEYEIE
ncbi:hypothetical protein [Candidatus Rariloculus sp.]|uniref:hypothetical protein n=1 Tax=Candidatus Rariloculus sp. TaxID=3101265 RepID=UPI003D112AB9